MAVLPPLGATSIFDQVFIFDPTLRWGKAARTKPIPAMTTKLKKKSIKLSSIAPANVSGTSM
jgi:hypothetical protein